MFGGASPLGKKIRQLDAVGLPTRRVVGLVKDEHVLATSSSQQRNQRSSLLLA